MKKRKFNSPPLSSQWDPLDHMETRERNQLSKNETEFRKTPVKPGFTSKYKQIFTKHVFLFTTLFILAKSSLNVLLFIGTCTAFTRK